MTNSSRLALVAASVMLAGALNFPTASEAGPRGKKVAAVAATTGKDAAAAPAATQTQNNAAQTAIKVEGFRSARFGMTKDELLVAIRADFGVPADKVEIAQNAVDRTTVLTAKGIEALPDGGKSDVSYVLGHSSKKLIQIGIAWSPATDEKLNADQIFANGNILRTYFLSQGYKPETVSLDVPSASGLVMFKGDDRDGRTTLLVLQGGYAEGPDKRRVLKPAALVLYYIADARNPDVYRVAEGLF